MDIINGYIDCEPPQTLAGVRTFSLKSLNIFFSHLNDESFYASGMCDELAEIFHKFWMLMYDGCLKTELIFGKSMLFPEAFFENSTGKCVKKLFKFSLPECMLFHI